MVKGRAKCSVLLQIRFCWVFPSPFNLDICTVNCTTETEGIQWEKAALNPLESSWIFSFQFSVVEERPDLHTPLQQTNEQTPTTSKEKIWIYSQLLSLPFTYWREVNLRTLINRRSLIGRCQIVTDTCENNVSKFVCKSLSMYRLAKPKRNSHFFFPRVSRAQRLAPARTRTLLVRLGAQCTDHWTKPWRWRARGTVDHAC